MYRRQQAKLVYFPPCVRRSCDAVCFILKHIHFYIFFSFFQAQYLARQDKPPLRSTNSDEAPNVFVVYFPDHEKHTKNITRFIKTLRKSGVNATADMFESTKSANDRGFYIYSKLIEAEYVFVVCSPLFLAAYEDVTTSQEPTSGMCFCLDFSASKNFLFLLLGAFSTNLV